MELITAVCDIWKSIIIIINRVDPKSSHHKEKLSFSFALYLYEMMDIH